MDDDYSLQDDDFFIVEEFIFPEDGGVTGDSDERAGDRDSDGMTCSAALLLIGGGGTVPFLLWWIQ
jgi:hypothetical protein